MSKPLGGAQSVHRVAEVLRCLSGRLTGLRLTDVASKTGLERPTVHRVLQALILEGMVRQDSESRRYFLGPTIHELGLAAAPEVDVVGAAAPSLDRLAAVTGDTVFLTSRSGYDSICLDRREGSYPVRVLTVEVGGRRPLGTTAGGVALLCALDEPLGSQLIDFNAARLSHYGLLTAGRLRSMVLRGVELGYGLNEDDIIIGVTAIGVALPKAKFLPELALSVVALSSRLTEPRRSEVVELLRAEAASLSRRLTSDAS